MRKLLVAVCAIFLAACSSGEDQTDPTLEEDMMSVENFDTVGSDNATSETASERTARLREKAKTDPEGADAEAIESMSRNEVIATAINSAGYLCARVVSAYPVGGNINVECIEYRNGSGRVRYRIDPNAGTVEPR